MRPALWRNIPILVVFAACASIRDIIPESWMSVPRAASIRAVALSADGKVTTGSQRPDLTVPKGSVRVSGGGIVGGEKALTEAFHAVDSFDFSESRGEVVFSVKRESDFDIGLVAIEGSEISWIPDDPADEVAVQWAPRGNKISYVVRARFGDVVRTLHIPTAASFGIDFPFARVNALGWDPQAERFAVSYSSPVASDAVDVLEYSGDSRSTPFEPASRLSHEIQPFATNAIVLQPPDIRYNEKLPLVVWVDPDPLRWSDARAELLKSARVALVITATPPDAVLWQRAAETAWIDASRAFVVGAESDGPAVHIMSDASLRGNRFRRSGNVVSVPAAVVESFAARFIADQLKRDAPPNGSSR